MTRPTLSSPLIPPPDADPEQEPPQDEPEPGETLEEAEDEIGINSWVDPDTGEPAEGHSPPHIEGE